MSGGSAGNLSALVAARARAAARLGSRPAGGWSIAVAESVHSSVATAARVIDVGIVEVPGDERGRLTGVALAATLEALDPTERAGVFAVVASAGATNAGTVDDLDGVADACDMHGLWFHVDGAYGGAGLVAPSVRERYRGIERADSFIVDPHKWLFAPYDCCALLYRDPRSAHGVFRQEAGYLDTVNQPDAEWSEWNPANYAYHLSRRARGLPLWFSLATYGTDAYRDAVEARAHPHSGDRRRDPLTRRARARDGTGAVGGAVPSPWVGRCRLRGVVAPVAQRAGRLRAADLLARREARAPLFREPADHDRPRSSGARHHGLSAGWVRPKVPATLGFGGSDPRARVTTTGPDRETDGRSTWRAGWSTIAPMNTHAVRLPSRPTMVISMMTAVAAALWISSPASAAPPERTPVHESFDMTFPDDTCDFPLSAHAEMKVTMKTFLDGKGQPVRGISNGSIMVWFTNGHNGSTRRLSVPGPTFSDAAGQPVRGTGAWVSYTTEGELVWAAGNLELDEWNTITSIRGRSRSVCEFVA